MAARWPILALAVAAAFALALVIVGGDSSRRSVWVRVSDATSVVSGQDIRIGGANVGSTGELVPVDGGRAARLELRLDPQAWPLRRASRLQLRWGGTASYANRYLALDLGAPTAAPIPAGGQLASAQLELPVELDQLTATFTPAARRHLRSMIRRGGVAFGAARAPLARALHSAPPALNEASHALADLVDSEQALTTLLRSGDRVVDAVYRSTPDVGRLVQAAGTTFTAVADQSRALRAGLARLPRTLDTARASLQQADSTLRTAGEVTRRLAPGVAELRRIARPLDDVLATVERIGPDARRTLATARRGAPDVTRLLRQARPLLATLGSTARKAAAEVKCVRPYAPDIAALGSNWADFLSWADDKDRTIRANVQNIGAAPFNGVPYNSAEAIRRFPGLTYAFPRPPGYNAGQPWFIPECGITKDALDPSKDPEARGNGR